MTFDPIRLRRTAVSAALFFLLPVSAGAELGLPHTFAPDTPARAAEVNANFRYLAPAHVVYVTGDADAAANGAALLQAADADALTALAGAPSEANPYLIQLRPGIYELGSTRLELPPGVHLAGAGAGVTRVSADAPPTSAIFLQGSSLRDLTVSIRSSGEAVSAVHVASAATSLLSHVALEGVGGGNIQGITTAGSPTVRIEDSSVSLDASNAATGLRLSGQAKVRIRNMDVRIAGTAQEALGLTEYLSAAGSLDVFGLAVEIRSDRSSGINRVFGIYSGGQSRKDFSHSHVRAMSPQKNETFALATLDTSDGALHFEHGALLTPGTSAAAVIRIQGGKVAIRVAASKLTGNFYWFAPPATGAPTSTTVTCVYVYEETFTARSGCFDVPH